MMISSAMQELESFFAWSAKTVDQKLRELIDVEKVEPDRLKDAICWSVFGGGKRFRPALVFATGRAFGAADQLLIRTASAVEMIHTYSLIHDDLPAMDDDDLRRGRETCHKKFDEATAILAGDELQSLAFHVTSEDVALPVEIRILLIKELSEAAARMVSGQQMDLEAEGKQLTVEEIERIHRRKTGALVRFSARAGAIIAGASERDLGAVSAYADAVGLLFQVTDDLLDVTQTTENLGKTAGKDVAAKKATYPNILGISGSREFAESLQREAAGYASAIDGNGELLVDISRFLLTRTN